MDKKRLIIAILFLLVCIGIGYLLYRVFFYKAPVPTETGQTGQGQNAELPISETGKPGTIGTVTGQLPTAGNKPGQQTGSTSQEVQPLEKHIVNNLIVSPSKDASSAAKFYNFTDGKFYRVDKDGKVTSMDDKVFYNVRNVTWSPTKEDAILEYPDGSNIYYDFDTKKQATLPKHWQEFSFAPQGEQIAAKSMALAPENRWLVASDPDGSNIKLVEKLGENAGLVNVDWSPNKQIVATSLTGEELGDDRLEVLFVGLNGENFKSTIVEGRDLRSKWSTEGNKLLYSVHSERTGFRPELWIVNAEGDNIGSGRNMLGLYTWADKCTFYTERYVYCGVPTKLDIGAGFAPGLADYTPDDIYKIDLNTGIKTKISTTDTHTIQSMFVSEDGKTLYFMDKNQQGLFSLPL